MSKFDKFKQMKMADNEDAILEAEENSSVTSNEPAKVVKEETPLVEEVIEEVAAIQVGREEGVVSQQPEIGNVDYSQDGSTIQSHKLNMTQQEPNPTWDPSVFHGVFENNYKEPKMNTVNQKPVYREKLDPDVDTGPKVYMTNLLDMYGIAGYTSYEEANNEQAIQDLTEEVKKILTPQANKLKEFAADFFIIPRVSKYGKLPYPVGIMTGLNKNTNDCFYYFFQLTHLGSDPMTAKEILDATISNQSAKQTHSDETAYKVIEVYDNVVGEDFKSLVLSHLEDNFASRGSINFISLQGSNITPKAGNAPIENVAKCIMSIGFNLILVSYAKLNRAQSGEINVAGINNIRDGLKGTLSINIDLYRPDEDDKRYTAVDSCGNLLRNDFSGTMKIEAKANQRPGRVEKQGESIVSMFKGYIDALPESITEKDVYNAPIQKVRLHPLVVLTQARSSKDIPSSVAGTLLAVANASIMTKQENYLAVLKNAVSSPLNCPGYYNKLCNITNETPENVKALDFKSKAFSSSDAVVNAIKEMFKLSPMMALDITSFSEQTIVDMIFAEAARDERDVLPDKRDDVYAAKRVIIEAACALTNDEFPANYNPDLIFNCPSITYPAGFYNTTTGAEKDLRYIDLATVLATDKGKDATINWIYASLFNPGGNNSNKFEEKISILCKTVKAGDAVITGYGTRIFFHPVFINTLLYSLSSAGLIPVYKPFGVNVEDRSDIQNLSSFYRNGTIEAEFGRQATMFQQPGMFFGGTQFHQFRM